MEIIENKFLKITVNEIGCCFNSIILKKENKELLHQVKDGGWPCQDVLLFPIIGMYKFTYNEQEYTMPTRHGFIRNSKFLMYKKKAHSVTLIYMNSSENHMIYPVDFKILVTFSLHGSSIKVHTQVQNLNKEPMYFSYGSHPGIRAFKGGFINLKNNNVYLPIEKGILQKEAQSPFKNILNIDKEIFKKYDTIVFKNRSKKVVLNDGKNSQFTYHFNSPLFAIWTNPNEGDFICVEPWWGIPSYKGEKSDIKERLYINKIDKKKDFKYSIKIKTI